MPNDKSIVLQIVDLARRTTDAEFDPLLACRVVADMVDRLRGVKADDLEFFAAVASEVDGLPLGDERKYWAQGALAERDAQAEDYRQRTRPEIVRRLEALASQLVVDVGDS